MPARRPVRTLADHRRVGVGNGDDARLEWNLLAYESARVAAAVGPLAVTEDPFAHIVHAGVVQERRRELGLAANLYPLVIGEGAALAQDGGREPVASHAAHERREADPLRCRRAEPELVRDLLGNLHDHQARVRSIVDLPEPRAFGSTLIADEKQLQLAGIGQEARSPALQCGVIACHAFSSARTRRCSTIGARAGPMLWQLSPGAQPLGALGGVG